MILERFCGKSTLECSRDLGYFADTLSLSCLLESAAHFKNENVHIFYSFIKISNLIINLKTKFKLKILSKKKNFF